MAVSQLNPATRVLIRTARIDTAVLALAQRLERVSGCPVALVVDGRFGRFDAGARAVIVLSRVACEGLGLYCPGDFAWKCGDYGYYLARRRFPQTRGISSAAT